MASETINQKDEMMSVDVELLLNIPSEIPSHSENQNFILIKPPFTLYNSCLILGTRNDRSRNFRMKINKMLLDMVDFGVRVRVQ